MQTPSLTGVHAYADRIVLPPLISSLYERFLLVGLMAKRAGSPFSDRGFLSRDKKGLLHPKPFALIGGANVIKSMARREELAAPGVEAHIRIQTGKVAGSSKHLGTRDTEPNIASKTTNSHDQKVKTAKVRWSKLHTEIFLWNTTIELAAGKAQIASATAEGTAIGMSDHLDAMVPKLYWGAPSDQDEDIWDSPFGLNEVLKKNNTYLGLDRDLTTYTDPVDGATKNYWASHRHTDAIAASLDLIDIANIDFGIQDRGPGIDVVLCAKGPYHAIKAEALSKNGTLIHRGSPEAAKLGITREAVLYGDVLITYDSGLRDWTGAGGPDLSQAVAGLTLGDWVFQTQAGKNFALGDFVDTGKYAEAGKDGVRGLLKTHYRMWCEHPENQIMFTNVTGGVVTETAGVVSSEE